MIFPRIKLVESFLFSFAKLIFLPSHKNIHSFLFNPSHKNMSFLSLETPFLLMRWDTFYTNSISHLLYQLCIKTRVEPKVHILWDDTEFLEILCELGGKRKYNIYIIIREFFLKMEM